MIYKCHYLLPVIRNLSLVIVNLNLQNLKKFCRNCNKQGHWESTCFLKYPHLKKVNITKQETILASFSSNNFHNSANIEFILDSGATIHTSYIKELFIDIKPTNTTIKWGNTSKSIKASGIGDILIRFTSTKKLVKFKNVLYVPELGVNLLSLSLITTKGYNLSFTKDNCIITSSKDDGILTRGNYKEGLSVFSVTKSINPTSTILNSVEENSNLNLDLDSNLDTSDYIDPSNYLESNNVLDNNNLDNSINTSKETLVVNNNVVHKRIDHPSELITPH